MNVDVVVTNVVVELPKHYVNDRTDNNDQAVSKEITGDENEAVFGNFSKKMESTNSVRGIFVVHNPVEDETVLLQTNATNN